MSTDPADDIARLAEGLNSPDLAVRLATIQALGESGRPEAVKYLLEIWEAFFRNVWPRAQDINDLHISALKALQELGPVAFDGFYALWNSDRKKWGFSLMVMGKVITDSRLLELAKSILESGDQDYHHAAMTVLGESRLPEVVPLLIKYIENDRTPYIETPDYSSVERHLREIGETAIPYLLAEVNNSNTSVRKVVATTLGSIGGERAVIPLISACSDESNWVRGRAVQALGRLGDARAVPHLIPRLVDTEAMFQSAEIPDLDNLAAEALTKIGTPEALEAVQQWQASLEKYK